MRGSNQCTKCTPFLPHAFYVDGTMIMTHAHKETQFHLSQPLRSGLPSKSFRTIERMRALEAASVDASAAASYSCHKMSARIKGKIAR